MWKDAFLLPIALMYASKLAGQASDRWNGSILPMPSIGKTPVQNECIVMTAKLPGCHVRKRAFLWMRGRQWGAGGGSWWRGVRSLPDAGAPGRQPPPANGGGRTGKL